MSYHYALIIQRDLVIGPEYHKHYQLDAAIVNEIKADSGFRLGYFVVIRYVSFILSQIA